MMYDQVNGVFLPDSVLMGQGNFIGIGAVLSVGDFRSENEWVQERKEYLRTCKYVGFSFHVVGSVNILPQVEIEDGKNLSLVLLHVRDVAQDMPFLGELFDEWSALNEEENKKEQQAKAAIQLERHKISGGISGDDSRDK